MSELKIPDGMKSSKLMPAPDLVLGLQINVGWGPIHFADCARGWMNAFAEDGKADDLRELEDLVRAALYHDKWRELGKYLTGLFQTYNRNTETYKKYRTLRDGE
jgi:hypothetical protein